jgi:hypothetical protein
MYAIGGFSMKILKWIALGIASLIGSIIIYVAGNVDRGSPLHAGDIVAFVVVFSVVMVFVSSVAHSALKGVEPPPG